jgi:hypothetical protein
VKIFTIDSKKICARTASDLAYHPHPINRIGKTSQRCTRLCSAADKTRRASVVRHCGHVASSLRSCFVRASGNRVPQTPH